MLTAADRKYLWWTLTLFALLGLVGAGTLLYKPLKLRYAIFRLEHVNDDDLAQRQVDDLALMNWHLDCLNAACAGNPRAMKTMVAWAYGPVWQRRRWSQEWMPASAHDPATAQPGLFFQELEGYPDDAARGALMDIICDYCYRNQRIGPRVVLPYDDKAKTLTAYFERMLNSGNAKDCRVAQAALEFAKRRFAKELAQAEKAEKAAPKPKKPRP